MKIGDKKIRTGLELAREEIRAASITAKIEQKVRKMLIEKFGYILSNYEIQQIFRRETERGDRRQESLARSQWSIMRSKERAHLMESLRRDIQEGKLFKMHERKEGLGVEGGMFKEENPKRERKASGITGNDKEALQAGNGGNGQFNFTGEPLSPFGTKQKRQGINLKQTFVNY